jgi:hypothetical protein
MIHVADDPTEGEWDISPLEEEGGLTWEKAGRFGVLF